ncbi:MAG TPA: transporter substrate-binding domain-containing protein [Tissierellaceae bacterium]|nr:transporter substrate-binding domain-containing protein [Tissierellaceae bacterium]
MFKGKGKKVNLLIILLLITSLILTACGGKTDGNGEKTVEDIKEAGKIVLGTSADYPPFEFHALIDGKDEIVGFDIELANYIAEKLGVELEISDMDFDSLITALGAGRVDMVIAGMNPDPEREANFTDIYYEANLAVLVMEDNPHGIKIEEDLNGKRIGVQIGTTQEDVASGLDAEEVLSLASNYDLVMNLKSNKIDCAIMELPVAQSFAKNNDDLIVVEGLEIDSGTDGLAIAVQKGNDQLTDFLNEIIAEVKEKGLIEEWMAKADELSSEEI